MSRTERTTTSQGVPALKSLAHASRSDWRCTGCNALLGKVGATDIHINFGRTPEFLAGLPASAVCPKCRTLNRTDG